MEQVGDRMPPSKRSNSDNDLVAMAEMEAKVEAKMYGLDPGERLTVEARPRVRATMGDRRDALTKEPQSDPLFPEENCVNDMVHYIPMPTITMRSIKPPEALVALQLKKPQRPELQEIPPFAMGRVARRSFSSETMPSNNKSGDGAWDDRYKPDQIPAAPWNEASEDVDPMRVYRNSFGSSNELCARSPPGELGGHLDAALRPHSDKVHKRGSFFEGSSVTPQPSPCLEYRAIDQKA